MTKALEGAIRGFLEELDPHSKYISNDEFEAVNEQMEGEFEGIGIEYSMLDGYITVISPIPGTPSDRAGIQSGDKIIEIDGKSHWTKNNKDFETADAIRDQLLELGVEINDSSDGTEWKLKS